MNIAEKLSAIQQEISVPKSLYNSFGEYKYRSAEGILEAVKPFEEKYKVAFIVSDEMVQLGDRYYVKATAQMIDVEAQDGNIGTALYTTAYAREALEKKKLDVSQITGTASSYARKYALNGLLLLDDAKDPDTDEYVRSTGDMSKQTGGAQTIDRNKITSLKMELKRVGKSEDSVLRYCHVSKFEDITLDDYKKVMDDMAKAPSKEEEGLPFR